jgi:glycosyltransferase involved in cell wall biosynthesis
MFWPPNVEGVLWLAHQVWPHVLAAADGMEPVLTVIGKRPPNEVTALAESLGASLDVTGYVSDLTGYLQETAVFVVPLLSGGGMRVKILDAWAWGLPVVSTTVGAEGVKVRPGVDALLADTPAEFAARIVDILRDRESADRLGSAGRASVLAHYDAASEYEPGLTRIYGQLLN